MGAHNLQKVPVAFMANMCIRRFRKQLSVKYTVCEKEMRNNVDKYMYVCCGSKEGWIDYQALD